MYYDGDIIYWSERMANGYGDITPSKAKMLKKQNGICPYCNSMFHNDDLIETHHKVYKSNKGEDKYRNFVLLHRHCHDALHRETSNATKNSQYGGDYEDQRCWY